MVALSLDTSPSFKSMMHFYSFVLIFVTIVALQLKAEAFHLVSGWNTVKPSAKRLPNPQYIGRASVGLSGATNKLFSFRGGAKTVIDIHNDDEFDDAVKSAGDGLIVVDFTASWCGPCKSIAPFYQELAAKDESVSFLKVCSNDIEFALLTC